MKQFAKEYPDLPILQVPLTKIQKSPILQVALAKLPKDGKYVQIPLTQISWYHHISLIPKIKEIENRTFYIMATAHEGWSNGAMGL